MDAFFEGFKSKIKYFQKKQAYHLPKTAAIKILKE